MVFGRESRLEDTHRPGFSFAAGCALIPAWTKIWRTSFARRLTKLKAFNAQDRKVSGMGYTELGDGKAPLLKCSELIARFSYNPKDGTFTTLDIDGD